MEWSRRPPSRRLKSPTLPLLLLLLALISIIRAFILPLPASTFQRSGAKAPTVPLAAAADGWRFPWDAPKVKQDSSKDGGGIRFRRGTPADGALIEGCMREARMNPLFLQPRNFWLAEAAEGGGVQGFGQIRPVPGASGAFELASVYVLPAARGRGLGFQVVTQLVSDFRASQPAGSCLLLLTLGSTAGFYERHGFRVLEDPKSPEARLPPLLLFEYLAGSVVARVSRGPGTRLVVMELER